MSKSKLISVSRTAESAARQFGETTLDNRVPVATPENIAFRYTVAGAFTRLISLVIDYLLIGLISALVLILIMMSSSAVAGFFQEFALIGLGLFYAFSFFFQWFSLTVCETVWGRTPGKWLLRLRVLTSDGRPINATQATIRNFLRLADMMPLTGMVGFGVMSMNRRFQRLGDLVAGTIVIHERKKFHHTVSAFADPRVAQLSEYIPASFVVSNELAHTLSMYVQRREYFSLERTREIASHLAIPLLQDFGLPADTSYDLLLCALYYRTFLATEERKEKEWRPPQLPPNPNSGGLPNQDQASFPQTGNIAPVGPGFGVAPPGYG